MAVLHEARLWLGTPYRHQQCLRGVGCDCLGLVRGIWQALYGSAPPVAQDYARDWSVRASSDVLLDAARDHCIEIGLADILPGDLLVFRWTPESVSRHLAVLATPTSIIHAYERHAVTESALVPSWRRRIAGGFRFPCLNISD